MISSPNLASSQRVFNVRMTNVCADLPKCDTLLLSRKNIYYKQKDFVCHDYHSNTVYGLFSDIAHNLMFSHFARATKFGQ